MHSFTFPFSQALLYVTSLKRTYHTKIEEKKRNYSFQNGRKLKIDFLSSTCTHHYHHQQQETDQGPKTTNKTQHKNNNNTMK